MYQREEENESKYIATITPCFISDGKGYFKVAIEDDDRVIELSIDNIQFKPGHGITLDEESMRRIENAIHAMEAANGQSNSIQRKHGRL